MSEEMKLLMAMCEAMGLKVERDVDYQETPVSRFDGHQIIHSPQRGSYTLVSQNGGWVRNDEGGYIRRLINPEISYKVTKEHP